MKKTLRIISLVLGIVLILVSLGLFLIVSPIKTKNIYNTSITKKSVWESAPASTDDVDDDTQTSDDTIADLADDSSSAVVTPSKDTKKTTSSVSDDDEDEEETPRVGKTYYVSPNGSDKNDGLSAGKAWATVQKVNEAQLEENDKVLFERNGEWRGQTIQCAPNVSYGAYGTGENPLFNGSKQNYADASLWVETETPNIYKLNIQFIKSGSSSGEVDDVGNLVFDGGKSWAIKMREGLSDLKKDLSFYHNDKDFYVYLRSDKGNPGERFSSIEIVTSLHGMRAVRGNTIENLTFKYSNFGVTTSNHIPYSCRDVVIRNCKFEWIGGCIFTSDTSMRLGNAIEFWGSCANMTVEGCQFSQIFDTAITAQSDNTAVVDGVTVRNNYIEKCHWGMEFWLSAKGSDMSNILIEKNTITKTGEGWSAEQRWSSLIVHAAHISDLGYKNFSRSNYVVRNNVFGTSASMLVKFSGTNWKPTIEGNTYTQYKDKAFGYMGDRNYTFNDTFIQRILPGIDPKAVTSYP